MISVTLLLSPVDLHDLGVVSGGERLLSGNDGGSVSAWDVGAFVAPPVDAEGDECVMAAAQTFTAHEDVVNGVR